MIRKIITYPNFLLMNKVKEVNCQEIESKILYNACKDLEDTLKENLDKTLNLSANQIGYNFRIISIFDTEDESIITLINPKLDIAFWDHIKYKDSEISYPNKFKYIYYPEEIEVSGFTENWNLIRLNLKNYNAKSFCKALNILNGKVF